MSWYRSLHPRNDPQPSQSPGQFWAPATLWRRHEVCFLHYIGGVQKTESKKPQRVLFPFLPCLVNLPVLQFLTAFDSLGFFHTWACKPSRCCACKSDLLCPVQFNPCDPGSVFSLFQEHEWSIREWTGTLSTVLVLVPNSAEHGACACSRENSPKSVMWGELVFASFQVLFLPRGF